MRLSYRNVFCVFTENLCAFVNGDSFIGHMKVVLSACLVIITSFMILDETEMHGCPVQKLFTILCNRGTLIFLSETKYNDLSVGIFKGTAFKYGPHIHRQDICTIAVCLCAYRWI